MTLGDPLRYAFEHKILPDGFLNHSETFIQRCTFNDLEIFQLYDILYKNAGMTTPHKSEDFAIHRSRVADNIFVLKFTMPEPQVSPECYFIYCIFDSAFQHLEYYAIEKDEDVNEIRLRLGDAYEEIFGSDMEDKEMLWVCGWDKNGNHLNYGKYEYEPDDMLNKCLQIYFKNEK